MAEINAVVNHSNASANGPRKVSSIEESSPFPVPGQGPGVLEMRVKEGSKIRNLLGFAMSRIQGEGGQSVVSQVLFTGSGRAITKTITCAEIMKRKVLGLHQVSKIQYRTVREVWESQEGCRTQTTINRTVPSISILLSKNPLDPQEPGYQPPDDLFSQTKEKDEDNTPLDLGKRHWSCYSPVVLSTSKRACLEEDKHTAP
ncbi:ribonuclease P protein subunit p25a [Chanos chanos]|uniref:Ribonuclease P protein subunit p25a n=1 Tax=Chanos chanos TaxID=29144 RepID=A0A6J2UMD3_CHACN|nr:ribonuclease P protein subunit p25-like protein [Chanos chanos]